MVAEIISVGTELLLGDIVNTNVTFLAKKCAEIGIDCNYQTVVGDNEGRIAMAVYTAMERADILIFCGGLGPTKDDMTKESVARALSMPLVWDEEAKQSIARYFYVRDTLPTKNNWKQALMIDGGEPLFNENGTAPGVYFKKDGKLFILLPGVPEELYPMFDNYVMPRLRKLTSEVIRSVTVKTIGVAESVMETIIGDLMEASNPTVTSYAKVGEVHLRITAKAKNEFDAYEMMSPVIATLKERFGINIYSCDANMTLEQAVVDLLRSKKMTLATVESCTGGMLSGRIVNVPGVSDVFPGGFVTYANKTKTGVMKVLKDTLDQHGAVSAQTAEEMVRNCVKRLRANAGIAVTGIAGPDGGTEEKPIGLVYIATQVEDKVTVKEYHFTGNRNKIRESVVTQALIQLREGLLG